MSENGDKKDAGNIRQPDGIANKKQPLPKEVGGRKGPEPTRYGDWEKNGIISDF
jgi:hypothetical protein